MNYLILGQHFIGNEITGELSGFPTEEESRLKAYVDQTCEAMRTGVFTYFAHPDMLPYSGPDKIYDKHFSRLIGCAIDCNVPLELNLLGVRDHRLYPSDRFFELCGKMGADICIGCDAHTPDVVYDRVSFQKALEMADRFNLKLNLNPTLREVKY